MSKRTIFIDHHIAELEGVDSKLLDSKKLLLQTCLLAAKNLHLTVVNSYVHKFKPQGLSLVLVVAESHFAAHTWPELKYMHVDVISCSPKSRLENLKEVLQKTFNPSKITTKKIDY